MSVIVELAGDATVQLYAQAKAEFQVPDPSPPDPKIDA
jgi:hypothetical protein